MKFIFLKLSFKSLPIWPFEDTKAVHFIIKHLSIILPASLGSIHPMPSQFILNHLSFILIPTGPLEHPLACLQAVLELSPVRGSIC